MAITAPTTRLEGPAMTTTVPVLRLQSLDAAIHFARASLELWSEVQPQPALEALDKCRHAVAELLAGVRPDGGQMSRNMTAIYGFLVKSLTEAQQHRDTRRINNAVRILEIERDTWRRVCGLAAQPARESLPVTGRATPSATAIPA